MADELTPADGSKWLVFYEDRDIGWCVFDTEVEARTQYERALQSWSCHLFAPGVAYDALRAENAKVTQKHEAAEALLRYYDMDQVFKYFEGQLPPGNEPWRERIAALEAELATLRAAPASEEVQRAMDRLDAKLGHSYPDCNCDLCTLETAVRAFSRALAAANEARSQLSNALQVRDTQYAAATARAEASAKDAARYRCLRNHEGGRLFWPSVWMSKTATMPLQAFFLDDAIDARLAAQAPEQEGGETVKIQGMGGSTEGGVYVRREASATEAIKKGAIWELRQRIADLEAQLATARAAGIEVAAKACEDSPGWDEYDPGGFAAKLIRALLDEAGR